jgi:hypothetical protein
MAASWTVGVVASMAGRREGEGGRTAAVSLRFFAMVKVKRSSESGVGDF